MILGDYGDKLRFFINSFSRPASTNLYNRICIVKRGIQINHSLEVVDLRGQ